MLSAFLERVASSAFEDGAADCALTVADWVMTARGCADPAAHLRGRYRTALGRERLLRRLGGLEAVMADCAGRAGLEETDAPVRGDVGLIEANGVLVAAICLGSVWAVKGHGLTVMPANAIIRAWRV